MHGHMDVKINDFVFMVFRGRWELNLFVWFWWTSVLEVLIETRSVVCEVNLVVW